MDISSPALMQYCSGGQTFDEVILHLMRADGEGKRVCYMEIKMQHVIISGISTHVMPNGVPFEGVTLKYAAIQWQYTQQKIGGNQAGKTLGAWSLTKNDKTYSC